MLPCPWGDDAARGYWEVGLSPASLAGMTGDVAALAADADGPKRRCLLMGLSNMCPAPPCWCACNPPGPSTPPNDLERAGFGTFGGGIEASRGRAYVRMRRMANPAVRGQSGGGFVCQKSARHTKEAHAGTLGETWSAGIL
jgi:hypothetical protein